MSAILHFSKKFIFDKNAANILEISRKHMFTASNTNIKNRVEEKKLKQKVSFHFKLSFA